MKKISIAEVLSALDIELAKAAILIGSEMDPNEVARLHNSDSPGDEDTLNTLKEQRKIIYFFGYEDCPVLADTMVEVSTYDELLIVKLP